MGNIIRAGAASADIIADVEETLNRATARGGVVAKDARRFLAARVRRTRELADEVRENDERALRLGAVLKMCAHRCKMRVAEIKDELYNQMGRHPSDAVWRLTFPPRAAFVGRGSPADRIAALRSLAARLSVQRRHPFVPAEDFAAYASEITALADELQAALDAYAPAKEGRRTLATLTRTHAALAQLHLSNLKSHWEGRGMGEAEIHDLIPDRPRPKPMLSPPPPAPPEPEPETEPEAPPLARVIPAGLRAWLHHVSLG